MKARTQTQISLEIILLGLGPITSANPSLANPSSMPAVLLWVSRVVVALRCK
jgi:hypothetical protein